MNFKKLHVAFQFWHFRILTCIRNELCVCSPFIVVKKLQIIHEWYGMSPHLHEYFANDHSHSKEYRSKTLQGTRYHRRGGRLLQRFKVQKNRIVRNYNFWTVGSFKMVSSDSYRSGQGWKYCQTQHPQITTPSGSNLTLKI